MPTRLLYLLAGVFAALLFLPFLGQVNLFDWDEINFAECAREMIVTKDYLRMQIDYMPFYEKPPLFIWMQVLSMKVFGVGAYGARLPNAITGIATFVTLFHAGKRVVGREAGIWWVALYAATWLPHFYFKTGIIDPVFNFFIFVAFFQVWLLRWGRQKTLHALLAGLFLGLAVLTKGPVAILVAGISLLVYVILNRGLLGFRIKDLLIVAAATLGVTGIWFGVEISQHGWTFIREFIAYQAGLFGQNIADHEEPWFYHPLVLLIGCFPASILFLRRLRRSEGAWHESGDWSRWMWILFWVVLILFSIVKTKIVHYSSLCYYPLTYLAAIRILALRNERGGLSKGLVAGLLAIGSVLAILITALPFVGIYRDKLTPLIQDPFAVANLQADVRWHWSEGLWGLLYLISVWVFVLMMRRDFRRGIVGLCIAQIVIIQVAVLHFTPKIEAYSQRAAIDYFRSFIGKDVYVQVLGYKSYAHLFYSEKKPSQNKNYYRVVKSDVGSSLVYEPNEQWLLHGTVDKPAYFICKLPDVEDWKKMPELEELGRKNGFVFFRRR